MGQDLMYVPMSMATNSKQGAEEVFAWVQREYKKIYARLGATSMMVFQNIVRISGAGFVTAERAQEVEAFWKSRDLYKMIAKTLNQTLEGILTNAKFVDRLRPSEVAQPAAWASSKSKL